jgi:hypothetical protein
MDNFNETSNDIGGRVTHIIESPSKYITFILVTLAIYAAIYFIITNFFKFPFYIYLGVDVVPNYLGDAISISESGRPSTFRHPGLLPKMVMAKMLGEKPLTVNTVNDVVSNSMAVGYFWILACLLIFFYLIRPYVKSYLSLLIFPFLFANPAGFYWLTKYSSNLFLIGWSFVVVGVVLRSLILNKDNKFVAVWLAISAFSFGFGSGIRIVLIPIFCIYVAVIIASIWWFGIHKRVEGKVSPLFSRIVIVSLIVYFIYSVIELVLDSDHVSLRHFLFFVVSIVVLLGAYFLYWKVNLNPLVQAVSDIGLYFSLGFVISCFGYVDKVVSAIWGMYLFEAGFGHKNALTDAIKLFLEMGPLFFFLYITSLLVIPTIFVAINFGWVEIKQNKNISPLLIFMEIILLVGIFLNIRHPSFSGSVPGVVLRFLLFESFPIMVLFLFVVPLIGFSRKGLQSVYSLAIVTVVVVSVLATYVEGKNLSNMASGELREIEGINRYIADENRRSGVGGNVLFVEATNEPAQIHYSIRNYGNMVGLARFKEAYPTVWELNPESVTKKKLEGILEGNNIQLLITKTEILENSRYRDITAVMEEFGEKENTSDSTVIFTAKLKH